MARQKSGKFKIVYTKNVQYQNSNLIFVLAPCSHVGHVFRKASPYTFPRQGGVNHVLHTNLARVAKVWMDDHATFYFKLNKLAKQEAELQDVSARLELRQRLKCHSFQWYLNNVWPENFMPSASRFYGKIQHQKVKSVQLKN